MSHARAAVDTLRRVATQRILAQRVRAAHPTLICHPSALWDYGFADLDAIEIGQRVSVAAYAEILVYKRTQHSTIGGALVLEDDAVVGTGVNLRAVGGRIRIGAGSAVSQHSVLVASTHDVVLGQRYIHTPYDETRSGVDVGRNVWIGAQCVLVAGVSVGDDAVIAAGAVVTKDVPAGELWAGVPARKLRDVRPPRPGAQGQA